MYYHFVEYPRRREYERYVSDHVHDRRQIDGETGHVVKIHDDVRYDTVLNPLYGVGHRTQDEQQQHGPPSFVQFAIGDYRLYGGLGPGGPTVRGRHLLFIKTVHFGEPSASIIRTQHNAAEISERRPNREIRPTPIVP